MKIAFLNTDDFTGGAAIASLRLAQTIIEKGHDVTYFCVNKKSIIRHYISSVPDIC